MRIKTKGIIKKIALALAGLCALGAVGFGVAKLVEFVKDDLKTITPAFDVGNLGTDGKFVDDESTLYTKEAFECDGLQIKLDFDNQIEYQIYFYDDLDNFIESTEVLSAAYSETVHDGYARIVIMPTNDEDEKISLTERVTYPGQMTIKVAKEQNVEYYDAFGRRLRCVDNTLSLRFNLGEFRLNSNGAYEFFTHDTFVVTSQDILSVKPGSSISCSYDVSSEENAVSLRVFEFCENNGGLEFIKTQKADFTKITLSDDTTHIIIASSLYDTTDEHGISFPEADRQVFGQYIVVE